MNNAHALSILEQVTEDVANLSTIVRTGSGIYNTAKQNTSSVHLQRGRESLFDTMTILQRDKEVVPKTDRDILCRRHDKCVISSFFAHNFIYTRLID